MVVRRIINSFLHAMAPECPSQHVIRPDYRHVWILNHLINVDNREHGMPLLHWILCGYSGIAGMKYESLGSLFAHGIGERQAFYRTMVAYTVVLSLLASDYTLVTRSHYFVHIFEIHCY